VSRRFATGEAPHWRAQRSVRRIMGEVLLALLPLLLVHSLVFGVAIWLQLLLAVAFALAIEAAALRLRGVPLRPFLGDLSAPLTAALFVLCLPPLAPWWVAGLGMLAAIGLAKHAYGGLGHNLFNPAMVGYAVVLVCFPRELAGWIAPGSADPASTLRAVFDLAPALDALAQPTPLDSLRSALGQGYSVGEAQRGAAFTGHSAYPSLAFAAASLLGGGFLLWRGHVRWPLPLAYLAGVALTALPFWLLDGDHYASPLQQLLYGGTLLAAFFIVTDPVSGCTSPRGRILFGLGAGALTVLIRLFGAYPDGIAFAVLLMNAAAPWIDLHTRPRRFGETA
jgi:Na+-translocating ferredoxin:NAD+ oxidoreductase subunit D